MINSDAWDIRFMEMAKLVSSFSKDPSSKIGAIAVNDKRVVLSTGWNGFPRGIADTCERLNDRTTKYKFVVHAEMNMVYNATYNGISLDKSTVYIYGLPCCSECAKGLIQVGVKEIVIVKNDNCDDRWKLSWENTKDMLDEVGILYREMNFV